MLVHIVRLHVQNVRNSPLRTNWQHHLLEDLNPDQNEVALATGHCLALAGPGSGKTKTNAVKAALLLKQNKRVVAVTFTREAAMELRSRIVDLSGESGKSNLLVGTFHSLCMLQSNPSVGLKSSFGKNIFEQMKAQSSQRTNIATEGDRWAYVHRAIEISGCGLEPEEAMSMIEQGKAFRAIGRVLDKDMTMMLEAYESILLRNNKMDFQDLIVGAVTGMKNGTVTPYQCDHMLVDEFQDTDELQYEWTAMHARKGVNVTVVGDDDQSIYAFRSAMGYRGMKQFLDDFNAQRVVLGTNYRCHEEVLSSASTLVQVNKGRLPKKLIAHKGPGGDVEWQPFGNRSSEANAAALHCQQALMDGKTCAVIARTNRILDEAEAEMMSYGIPYVRISGGSILDRIEASLMLDIVDMIFKEKNSTGLDGVLSWAGITEASLKEFHGKFGNAIIMGNAGDMKDIDADDVEKEIWRGFAKKLNEIRFAAKNGKAELAIGGVATWMNEHAKKDYQKDIINSCMNILVRIKAPIEKRTEELRRRKSGKEMDDKSAVLITAHGSKGLEWDTVWISGANDGIFPEEKSAVEEERRLFYVAMTRARKHLVISSSKQPSQFIHEAGVKRTDINAPQQKTF